ncbi:MAG TPA: hypothetical protein PLP35_03495 [Caldisericia bacterium]|nr:hypothetical protein [Caldisericia bacterium]HPI83584.1 hypothetical protein [Caldisericia bacterium]HRV74956.1 hypothetical protein [Caldisericia bacterium]
MFRRKIAAFLVFVFVSSVLGACGSSGVRIDPKPFVEEYLGHINNAEFALAYEMLDKNIRDQVGIDDFISSMKNPETGESVSDIGMEFKIFDSFTWTDENASVYGEMISDEMVTRFRMPCTLDGDKWAIAQTIIEYESQDDPAHYFDNSLLEFSKVYFNWMLDAESDLMWENLNERLKESMTYAQFVSESVSTVSGATPRDEGFGITPFVAFSTDPIPTEEENIWMRKGVVYISITTEGQNPEDGTLAKCDFEQIDNVWKADFTKLEVQ